MLVLSLNMSAGPAQSTFSFPAFFFTERQASRETIQVKELGRECRKNIETDKELGQRGMS